MQTQTSYDREELAAWIRLSMNPVIDIRMAHQLLVRYGLPQNIFTAPYSELMRLTSLQLAQQIRSAVEPEVMEQIEKTENWLADPANTVLTLSDERYPRSLLEIADPPLVLYVKGKVELLARPCLAMAGSREATRSGYDDAKEFARALSEAGLTIVSGLSRGTETSVHCGALRGKSSTVAVMATGADLVYPAVNRKLAHEIAEKGCLISELPLGTGYDEKNQPRTSRLISGLAKGFLVVEASLYSPAVRAAKVALEQGREIFAVPGSIHSPLSRGCHALIRQGAKLVETASDVLEELKNR